jgi:hypothetical protein
MKSVYGSFPGKVGYAGRGGGNPVVVSCKGFLSPEGSKFFSVFPAGSQPFTDCIKMLDRTCQAVALILDTAMKV